MKAMLTIAFAAMLLMAVAVGGLVAVRQHQSQGTNAPSASVAPFGPDDRSMAIRALKLKAVRGSGEAAAKLAQLYAHCHYGTPSREEFEKCADEGVYWTDIALENGNLTGIKYKIDLLVVTKRCVDAFRAEFWLSRLRKLEPHYDYLDLMQDDIEDDKRHCSW